MQMSDSYRGTLPSDTLWFLSASSFSRVYREMKMRSRLSSALNFRIRIREIRIARYDFMCALCK